MRRNFEENITKIWGICGEGRGRGGFIQIDLYSEELGIGWYGK